jgi:chemotaxis protein MotB
LSIALGAALLAGGCVSKAEHDRALAANRRADLQLRKTQEVLRDLQSDNERLAGLYDESKTALSRKQEEVDLLAAAKADLKQRFDELSRRYAELLQGPKPPEFGPPVIRVLPAQVDKALQGFAQANPELVEYQAKYGMIKLKSDLTFEPGSDYVQAKAQAALAKFAEILNAAEAAKFNVFIAGHTDDIPIAKPETKRRHPNNWYLSVHRAVAVQEVLLKSGVAPARTCAMGFGEYHPIAPNAPGKKGNKLNRRVEVWIVPPDRFLTPPEEAEAS